MDGERTPAADFATLLDRFYAAATQTLLRRDAVIDKLIGDEVMAFFVRASAARTIATKPSVRGWSC
jgi:class 3 adenylate cyclase